MRTYELVGGEKETQIGKDAIGFLGEVSTDMSFCKVLWNWNFFWVDWFIGLNGAKDLHSASGDYFAVVNASCWILAPTKDVQFRLSCSFLQILSFRIFSWRDYIYSHDAVIYATERERERGVCAWSYSSLLSFSGILPWGTDWSFKNALVLAIIDVFVFGFFTMVKNVLYMGCVNQSGYIRPFHLWSWVARQGKG